MEYRQFGKTGHKTSVLTLGGCGFGDLHSKNPEDYQQKANEAFEKKKTLENKSRKEKIDKIISHPLEVFEKD